MRSDRIIGVAAALLAVGIWAGWIVGTRGAMTGAHDPAALGLLRFSIPALVFAPVWLRMGLRPRGAPLGLLVLIAAGSGAPFFLLAATGMQFAPAADAGPLMPGTMPLFVALLSIFVLGERIDRGRLIGYALIALGVVAITWRGLLVDGAWRGHAFFLSGAFLWALYTVAFRRAGISAIEAAAFSGLWSTVMLLPFGAAGLFEAVQAGRGAELLGQTVLQGFLSGVVALAAFGTAVSRLGASRASTFAALAPGVAAALAIVALGEHPDAASVSGIVLTTLGVILGVQGTSSPGRGARKGEAPLPAEGH